MTILQLEYFLSICELGGIRATAQRACVSEPAISVALKRLETELGFSLFVRKGNKMALTENGEYLRDQAIKIVTEFESLTNKLQRRKQEQLDVLRLGIPTSLCEYIFAPFFSEYSDQNAALLFDFLPGSSEDQASRVAEGSLELAICDQTEVKNTRLEFVPLTCEEVVGFVQSEHPLALEKNVSAKDLKNVDLLLFSESASLTKMIRRWFHGQGIIPSVRAYSNRSNVTVSTVKKSYTAAFCLSNVFFSNPLFQQEHMHSFSLSPNVNLTYGLICRKKEKLSEKAQDFYDFCRNHTLFKTKEAIHVTSPQDIDNETPNGESSDMHVQINKSALFDPQ